MAPHSQGSSAVVTAPHSRGSSAVVTAPHSRGSSAVVMPVPNPLRGEFAAVLGGERALFDTTLGTVALIEERCGGVPIVEAINRAVFGRRASDAMALIAGALAGGGHPEPEALAARTAAVEAEAFVLGLMGALGFEVVPKPHAAEKPHAAKSLPPEEASGPGPFAVAGTPGPDSPIGGAGAASRSAP